MTALELRNLLSDARVLCRREDHRAATNLSVAEFDSMPTESLVPVVRISSWRGKQSYEGRWWLASTGRHVPFASLWERDVLTCIDFAGDIAAVVRDPVVILSGRNTRTLPLRPWLLVQKHDGGRRVFLKGADRDRLSELAEILVESSTDAELPILPANDEMRIIRWLAGYRFTRFRLPDDVERQVRMCCSLPQTIPEAVARAAMATSYDEPSIRANLYSQMWRRSIQVADDRRELSDATSVCAS